MAQVNFPKFIETLRAVHQGLLVEGQRRQDTILRLSPEDSERVLTAALIKTVQECMQNGYIVDDSNLRAKEALRHPIFKGPITPNGRYVRH